jgi:hypothetical protein
MAKDNRPLIATIEERVTFSTGGRAAVVVLLLFQLVIIFAWGVTKSAVQEVLNGFTGWVGGVVYEH